MAEYIEREALLNDSNIIVVQTRKYCSIEVVPVEYIADLPAADVAPVRHGKLSRPYVDEYFGQFADCKECGTDNILPCNYCRECGARMDGENDSKIC